MLSTVVSVLGLSVAIGALVVLGHVSGFSSAGGADVRLLGGAILAFLLGILLFGWSLGKRTQY